MEASELLTIEEFCKLVKVSRRTVYRWIKSGRLKASRAGKLWRIKASEVENFLSPEAAKPQEALSLPLGLTADERLRKLIMDGEA